MTFLEINLHVLCKEGRYDGYGLFEVPSIADNWTKWAATVLGHIFEGLTQLAIDSPDDVHLYAKSVLAFGEMADTFRHHCGRVGAGLEPAIDWKFKGRNCGKKGGSANGRS